MGSDKVTHYISNNLGSGVYGQALQLAPFPFLVISSTFPNSKSEPIMTIGDCNAAFEQFCSCSRHDLIGSPLTKLGSLFTESIIATIGKLASSPEGTTETIPELGSSYECSITISSLTDQNIACFFSLPTASSPSALSPSPSLESLVQLNGSTIERLRSSLRERQIIQQAILDNIPDIAWLKDPESRFIAVNNPFAALCGKTPAEVVGLTDLDIWPTDLAQNYIADDKEVIRTKKPMTVEEKAVGCDGKPLWIETIKTPFFNDHGEVIGTTGISHNITQRKEYEELLAKTKIDLENQIVVRTAELAETNNQLRARIEQQLLGEEQLRHSQEELSTVSKMLATLIDGIGDPLFVKNREHKWVLLNQAFCDFLGCVREDIIGKSDYDFFPKHEADIFWQMDDQVFQSGQTSLNEEEFTDRNGVVHYISTKKTAFITPGGEAMLVGIIRDLTDRKQVETELERAKEAAELANRAKGEFLARMSHEIRTPLHGIIASLDIALDSHDTTSALKELLESGKQSAASLLEIVNDILDSSKIDAGKIDLVLAPFELIRLINDLHSAFIHRAHEQHIRLITQIDPAIPKYLLGDKLRLAQILNNLVANALKFTPANGTVTTSVKIEENLSTSVKLQFMVSDTGIGIPEQHQRSIFDAFNQADTSITRKFGGTGLGLTICAQLLKLMGSDLRLISEPTKGSDFFFTLQLTLCDPPITTPDPLAQKSEIPKTPRLKILVAEDNLINQTILTRMLEKHGHQITLVNNGVEAVKAAKSDVYDIILMDIGMPEKSGDEAAAEIKKDSLNRTTPIAALTAHTMPGDKERFLASGLDDFLAKPFTQAALFDLINRIVKK